MKCLTPFALMIALPSLAISQTPTPAQSWHESSEPVTLTQYLAQATPRMMAADADGDGRISRAEFEAQGRRGNDRKFDIADSNHDGYLDKTEIQAVLTRRFQKMDANGDGVVTSDERAASHAHGQHRSERQDTSPHP